MVHNETEWHRKQRTYQNPSCKTCNMNFPARIAYEKHMGTFTHIQKTVRVGSRGLTVRLQSSIGDGLPARVGRSCDMLGLVHSCCDAMRCCEVSYKR